MKKEFRPGHSMNNWSLPCKVPCHHAILHVPTDPMLAKCRGDRPTTEGVVSPRHLHTYRLQKALNPSGLGQGCITIFLPASDPVWTRRREVDKRYQMSERSSTARLQNRFIRCSWFCSAQTSACPDISGLLLSFWLLLQVVFLAPMLAKLLTLNSGGEHFELKWCSRCLVTSHSDIFIYLYFCSFSETIYRRYRAYVIPFGGS